LGLSEETSEFRAEIRALSVEAAELGIGISEVTENLLQGIDADLVEDVRLRE
jgi:hypothetical protein